MWLAEATPGQASALFTNLSWSFDHRWVRRRAGGRMGLPAPSSRICSDHVVLNCVIFRSLNCVIYVFAGGTRRRAGRGTWLAGDRSRAGTSWPHGSRRGPRRSVAGHDAPPAAGAGCGSDEAAARQRTACQRTARRLPSASTSARRPRPRLPPTSHEYAPSLSA